MLKNYVQTCPVTTGKKGAVSAPQVYFIFCGIAAKCFINPRQGYAAKFTDLYGLLQTGE